jgi:hypothetical protein
VSCSAKLREGYLPALLLLLIIIFATSLLVHLFVHYVNIFLLSSKKKSFDAVPSRVQKKEMIPKSEKTSPGKSVSRVVHVPRAFH